MICRCMIEPLKFGATAFIRSISRSAYVSRSSSCPSSSAHSAGTHCVNIDITCTPSGASVLSNTVGIAVSLNGSVAACPNRASWNAFSR